ncbi:hypothetical protein FVE85_2485 [Porphyridium purpureum]|uniref:Uncharacterized protein n=1 Tax=Porphyridium purpureum TaxID=35688 RepID=A0A5J4YKP0_PORPP|nr:hypothetical protein FVE85_2485 [Porphyridium purpureum]|eukprot:POR2202..scf291_13
MISWSRKAYGGEARRRQPLFRGALNPERRRMRMTLEHGTLPQSVPTNVDNMPGSGATEGLAVTGILLGMLYKFAMRKDIEF